MTEIWTSIPSYPGYEISNTGRVRRGDFQFKDAPFIKIRHKHNTVARLMAEAFLNDGQPLRRNQVVTGNYRDLSTLVIRPAAYHVRRNNHKALLAECLIETFPKTDAALSDLMFERHKVRLTPKTCQHYRLAAGYKKREWKK